MALLALAGCKKEQLVEYSKLTISADTTWQGTLVLGGDVLVEPGATLTILPGTVVKFKKIDETSGQNMFGVETPYYPQAELIIRGRLIARGTPSGRIVFTSAERDASPADWGAINFLGSEGNVIEYAKILCAYNGIHAHGSAVLVSHNEFVKNGVGISFKSEEETPGVPWFGKRSDLVITHNLITRNKGGIGFRNSKALISQNRIIDNKFFGLWPKEDLDVLVSYNEISGNQKGIYLYQARGIRFENNNIYNNSDYDVAVAEAQDYPVDAGNNWFGTVNLEKIAAKIFDKKDDPDLAEIKYQPLLNQQVKLEKQ